MLLNKLFKPLLRHSGFLALLLVLFPEAACAFDRAELISTPVVKYSGFDKTTQKVTYTVDFVFKKCPDNYFLYYDRKKNKMVIDFYSSTIAWADSVMPGSFNGELLMANVETPWSIKGQKGQIMFSHQREWRFNEEEWHYESEDISDQILRVKLWRILKPAVKVKPPRKNSGDTIQKSRY